LILRDMPSIKMDGVFENLPEVAHLEIRNLDEFKKDQFLAVHKTLLKYKGLKHLGLELLYFDLNDVKD
jgi:hypothetical protein